MRTKITGIKSVDFKIKASGHGCVNWNGSVSVQGDDGKEINNHSIPKLRGFTNKTGQVKEGSNYEYKIKAQDIDLKETPMYISQNSLRHHVFKREMPFHLGKLEDKHALMFLTSPVGLLRGYAITGSVPIMKKSPFLLEDLVDLKSVGNFEVLSTASSKESSETGGFYSKTTVGDTQYVGYGSINIEELQFISCSGIFGRSAVGPKFTEDKGPELASKITKMLEDLKEDASQKPQATFEMCYVRRGSLLKVGEAGILLNDDAITLLVNYLLDNIRELYVNQSKNYMRVDEVVVDYNDSTRPMRIKDSESNASSSKNGTFAVYYEPATEEELKQSMTETASMMEVQKSNQKAKASAKDKQAKKDAEKN